MKVLLLALFVAALAYSQAATIAGTESPQQSTTSGQLHTETDEPKVETTLGPQQPTISGTYGPKETTVRSQESTLSVAQPIYERLVDTTTQKSDDLTTQRPHEEVTSPKYEPSTEQSKMVSTDKTDIESTSGPSTELYDYAVYVDTVGSGRDRRDRRKRPVEGILKATFYTNSRFGAVEVALSKGSETFNSGSHHHYSVQLPVKVNQLGRMSLDFIGSNSRQRSSLKVNTVTIFPAYEGGINDRRRDVLCASFRRNSIKASRNRPQRLRSGRC